MPKIKITGVPQLKSGGTTKWIQKTVSTMRKDKPCTGSKFGSSTCPPGSKRYNLALTFKKMASNRRKEEGGEVERMDIGGFSPEYSKGGSTCGGNCAVCEHMSFGGASPEMEYGGLPMYGGEDNTTGFTPYAEGYQPTNLDFSDPNATYPQGLQLKTAVNPDINQNAPGYFEAQTANSIYKGPTGGPGYNFPTKATVPINSYAKDYLPYLGASAASDVINIGRGVNSLVNPDKYNFGRVNKLTPHFLDFSKTIAMGNKEIGDERAVAGYNVRNASSSAPEYLSSTKTLGVGAMKTKADFLSKIGEAEANSRAQIMNEVDTKNAGIEMQNIGIGQSEQGLELQGKSRAQDYISSGIGRIGTKIDKYGEDVAKNNSQDYILSMLGDNNYEYADMVDPKTGKTRKVIVPKNS